MNLSRLCLFVLIAVVSPQSEDEIGEAGFSMKEYPPFDGYFNNRAFPEWGTIDAVLSRFMHPVYNDGVFLVSGISRTTPRKISTALFEGESGLPSLNNKTAFFVFFGQHVLNEIVDLERMGCPPEHLYIDIPAGDFYDPEETGTKQMPFMRARYDQVVSGYYTNHPREQINQVTSFIDGGSIYGSLRTWANLLRLKKTVCSERTRTSHLFASQDDPTDCRGELESIDDAGLFPLRNDIGLPLKNYYNSRDHVTRPVERYYRVGNRMANENPFLLSLSIMWFRHHNWWARRIRSDHKDWDDYTVFLEARIRNVATFQKITLYDWLPILIGNCTDCDQLPPYEIYNPITLVAISNVFEGAAMRYLETLFPPGVFIRSKYDKFRIRKLNYKKILDEEAELTKAFATDSCEFYTMSNITAGNNPDIQAKHQGKPALRLCNAYWNSDEAVGEYGIAPLIMGSSSQIAEREDQIITPDLQRYFYGPRHFSRRDTVSMAIQRGRDHGLVDYNSSRVDFGYPSLSKFEDINPELFAEDAENGGTLLQRITEVHDGRLDKIDIFTGGYLETKDGNPGNLFRQIILDQFRRIRDGDRFWFESTENGLLNETEIEEIRSTTIRDVILRTNPELDGDFDIQENPFLWNPAEDQKLFCPQPFQLNDSVLEECEPLRIFDYFSGSDSPFLGFYCFLGGFAIGTLSFMYLIGYIKDKSRKKENMLYSGVADRQKEAGKLATRAVELLGKYDSHKVQVKLGSGTYIMISSHDADRKMHMEGKTNVYLSNDRGRNVMLIQNELATYDLILSFPGPLVRQLFLDRLSGFLVGPLKDWTAEEIKYRELMKRAYSKEQRDKALAKFFRAALTTSMNMQNDEPLNLRDKKKTKEMLNIKISKHEFAHLLKMREDSLFLQHLFNTADEDKDDLISFQEFLNIIVLFTSGTDPDAKLRLMFNMYDLDKSGRLHEDEFQLMVRSMIESFSTKVDTDYLNRSISRIMTSAGADVKLGLTFDDFKNLMMDYNKNAGVNLAPSDNRQRRLSEAAINIPGLNGRRISEAAINVPGLNRRRISEAAINIPGLNRRRISEATINITGLQKRRKSEAVIDIIDLNKRRISEATINIGGLDKNKRQPLGLGDTKASEAMIFLPDSEHLKRRKKSSVTALERYRASVRRIERESATDSQNADPEDDEIGNAAVPKTYEHNFFRRNIIRFEKFIQYHTLEIFWIALYTGICAGIFLYYFYTALYDHSAGWLGVSGLYTIPVAYGSAGVLMYNLATLLYTMCRNAITYMRDTWLHRYIPFDQAVNGHKLVALSALCFAITHVVAHGINFYAMLTQYSEDLLCLYPDYFYQSHFYPTFFYWGFQTYTGITGIVLFMIAVIVYVFSLEYARRKIYAWFSWTHSAGVFLLYLFIALHGNGMMIKLPTFFIYYIGPLKFFLIDKLWTLSRKKTEIQVLKAEMLPSDVTHLTFKRPSEFNYKAGQWVKIACVPLSPEEFHPFTLTSAPHEEHLSVHIRAVGPWTRGVRKIFDKKNLGEAPYPKLYVDGPFGEGHQDWYKYEISVLIGGGIGVTPFASILKDWINSEYKVGMNCKRIYFIWITRDQKQYEWLTDIIQDVEKRDKAGMFRAHIFITQFPEKFDLRTTMLYICEKNFHKVAGKSMFTGLKSETHFGRPNFKQLFEYLSNRHHTIDKLGIFSRGPRPMTRDVDRTCAQMNQFEGPIFSHHFEN